MVHGAKRRLLNSVVLIALCAASLMPEAIPNRYAEAAGVRGSVTATNGSDEADDKMLGNKSEGGYDQYLSQFADAPRPDRELLVRAETFSGADGMEPKRVSGIPGADGTLLETDEKGSVTWTVDVPETGLYGISVRYYPVEGKGANIDRELLIDGNSPFSESRNLMFRRIWSSAGEPDRDERGNDLHVKQIEKPQWLETPLQSSDGRHNEPYLFYFTEGSHTITLVSSREKMIIDYLKLSNVEEPADYAELAAGYERAGNRDASDVLVKVQAESAELRSSQVLYPMMDRSSPALEPYHMSQIRLNTIGGYNWSEAGQWMTWEIEVPEDGLYHIGVKQKQGFQRGMTSYRKLYIDGKMPFKEMESIGFGFSTSWKMTTLGDGSEPYKFYLTKGKHELKMEVTLGEMDILLRTVESSVLELNRIYRRIIMVTGTVPDEYRDYQLEQKIPELVDVLSEQADILSSVVSRVEAVSGGSSDRTATLNRLIYQLRDMAEKPDTIARRLETFKSNTSSLGDWIYSINYMPLSLDYITVASPDKRMPSPEADFWGKLKHHTGSFMLSFFTDYNQLGASVKTDKKIEVWMTQGIDQAKIVKRLLDETFTPETGISVEIKVVSEAVLLQAMLAGRGPDVAFALPDDKPVNYALRHAVEDLSAYPGFEEVKERFHESALVPYSFDGGTYALPSEQDFPVLFYRKDIMGELGLDIPDTWDDVFELVPELQKQNLLFGFPIQVLVRLGSNVQENASLPVNATYGTMLFQNGGELYRDGGKESALDTETAVKAFMDWTDLYTTYKLPLTTDFVNRFRSGEMPIAIADYTRFNIISIVAPELKGLWDFTVVPGMRGEDGMIRRDVPANGKSVVMLEDSKRKHEAWAFMKWWTDAETQAKYSLELEGIFGPAGRNATANLEAVARIPWQVDDYNTLMEQWGWARGVPEVAGGYFTGRHLDNAFRSVVISDEDPREALDMYTRFINDEIKKKRKEFGLPNE
ncbi:extracellular solute-binding protein [Paenibacillus sp. LHD-117]|uniref:extracellular solute-binding protein n=1 Tax=Paenibacillus sp. LHD-117 TaxID=3071412 RepID=UPI0027DF6204|nr:extracellular solute-binding protein [Paenibacillus sp. LHD-117]MDQ6421864.1 extracellular solute-binding protein [Paenibacillus sp. LHD-117]